MVIFCSFLLKLHFGDFLFFFTKIPKILFCVFGGFLYLFSKIPFLFFLKKYFLKIFSFLTKNTVLENFLDGWICWYSSVDLLVFWCRYADILVYICWYSGVDLLVFWCGSVDIPWLSHLDQCSVIILPILSRCQHSCIRSRSSHNEGFRWYCSPVLLLNINCLPKPTSSNLPVVDVILIRHIINFWGLSHCNKTGFYFILWTTVLNLFLTFFRAQSFSLSTIVFVYSCRWQCLFL